MVGLKIGITFTRSSQRTHIRLPSKPLACRHNAQMHLDRLPLNSCSKFTVPMSVPPEAAPLEARIMPSVIRLAKHMCPRSLQQIKLPQTIRRNLASPIIRRFHKK